MLLKRIDPELNLYSAQVDFLAHPFGGREFTSGDSIHLSDYQGKYLYLEFWGSWCSPCISEIPNLKKAYDHLDHNKIEFLGIVCHDKKENLQKILQDRGIDWPQIFSNEENNIVDLYGVEGFPRSFLIDKEGKIVAKNLRGEDLLKKLEEFIN